MEIVILAAGKGTRMHSSQPKVMHSIGGKPMLAHVIDTAWSLVPDKIHAVVGFAAEVIEAAFETDQSNQSLSWVLQSEQLGTGHAVQQSLPGIDISARNIPVLVLFWDVPLVRQHTLSLVLAGCNDDSVSVLTVNTERPQGLGRIIRNESGEVTAIVEERDATAEQKQIM